MKFTCTQIALSKALNIVSKAVSTRTTIPILKGILLTVQNNRLTLAASDLDIGIETSIEVSDATDGAAVVSAKLFEEIIRRLPAALVKLERDDQNNLHISCLSSDFSIVALPADEFPAIGSIKEEYRIPIQRDSLRDLIKKTTFSASIDDKKGILTGCLFKLKKEEIVAVALDGFRMAVAVEQAGEIEGKSMVVPARILNEIAKLLSESVQEEEIVLLLDDKKMEIRTEDTRVISRLMEGDFIKYEDIVPKTHKTRCVLARQEMLASIERASLLAREGKNNLIKVTIADGQMEITSRSEEGNVKEIIACEMEGDELVIGFNSKYIAEALRAVNDEEVVFEMSTSTSPCLVKPVEGNSYMYLILPVRIAAS
jgi:DNA polymerase-3 subunit beta